MKIDAMRQHYQTILGDIPEEELNQKVNAELTQYEGVGKEFNYRSYSSNEDYKYSTLENQEFSSLSKKKRERHVLRLWRTLFNKTRGLNAIISQFSVINTKLAYFGRQLLAYD